MPDPTLDRLADRIRRRVRDIPDFPQPGIQFKDLTPVLSDPDLFSAIVRQLADDFSSHDVDLVVGIEARGFIFAAPVALHLGTGFAPVRKPGKLPFRTRRVEYALEYGTDALEAHVDAVQPGQRILLVDDVLATGGTLRAGVALVRRQGARVCAAEVLVELSPLGGRAGWDDPAPLRAVLAV